MRLPRFALPIILAAALAGQAAARPDQLIVSVWNPEACAVTDVSVLSLPHAATITHLDVWYAWSAGETTTSYNVSTGGRTVATGTMRREQCDPYQPTWCVARGAPNVQLSAGTYEVKVGRRAICRNAASAGHGFIRAYGSLVSTSPPPHQPPPVTTKQPPVVTKQPPTSPQDCGCQAGDEMCLTLCRHNPGRPSP